MNANLDLSARATSLVPSQIREVAELGMRMDDVIPLWFGESAWPTPDIAVNAATEALANGDHFYQPNSGKYALREAIEEYHQRIYSQSISIPRITVTASGMQGVMLTAQALINPGDEVVVVQPAWPNLGEAFRIMGATITPVCLKVADNRWCLPLDELLAALRPDTRALVVNSPNNPTGWTLGVEDQKVLLEHCRNHDIWIISDDVYSRLYPAATAAPSFLSIAEPDDKLVSINSFSKAFSMTGWRLGWIVAPALLEPTFAMLNEFNIAGPPAFVQSAGVAVLQNGEDAVALLNRRLNRAFTIVQQALLDTANVELIQPTGAFYAMLKLHGMHDSVAIAKDLLVSERVGMAPGIAFGESARPYLRLCYAQPEAVLTDAMTRFSRFMEGYGNS